MNEALAEVPEEFEEHFLADDDTEENNNLSNHLGASQPENNQEEDEQNLQPQPTTTDLTNTQSQNSSTPIITDLSIPPPNIANNSTSNTPQQPELTDNPLATHHNPTQQSINLFADLSERA